MTGGAALAAAVNLRDEMFLARWRERSRSDPALAAMGAGQTFAFAMADESGTSVLRVADGMLTGWTLDPELGTAWEFSLCANAEVWSRFFAAEPPPRYHNLFALLMRVREFSLQGDRIAFLRRSAVVRRLLEIARELHAGKTPEAEAPPLGPASALRGGYVEIALDEGPQTIYYEEAGQGPVLLCLHTAGSDSRQYQRLLRSDRLTSHWRLVAFDLPGHGKSAMFGQTPISAQPTSPQPAAFRSPSLQQGTNRSTSSQQILSADQPTSIKPGAHRSPSVHPDAYRSTLAQPGTYRLSTDLYARTIRATMEALGIEQPVVVGSSMGGEICLELAYRYPDEIRAVIACESAARVPGRKTPWVNDPRIDSATAIPEYIYGLMAPTSPAICKQEVWWQYSQGGYGTFAGDVAFYAGDWDATDRVAKIDTARCPVYMLTGEYDYSCTPELSAETAALIPGARFTVMKRLGHFPMSENPSLFIDYIEPVLAEIAAAAR